MGTSTRSVQLRPIIFCFSTSMKWFTSRRQKGFFAFPLLKRGVGGCSKPLTHWNNLYYFVQYSQKAILAKRPTKFQFLTLTLKTKWSMRHCQKGLGTIHILRNQWDWVGGVGKMIMFHAKKIWFTNKVWLQGGWVGFKKVKILIT